MAKVDRSILQANDQNMGDFGDPDKLEASISHLADKIDENDSGFNTHKTATVLAHPDKSVTEAKLGDLSVSRRTIQPGAVGVSELDPAILSQPTSATGVQAKLQEIDEQLADITYDVKSFGAKGDGVTDDLTAIQNAINYVSSVKGKLIFSKGTGDYLVSDHPKLRSNMIIEFTGDSFLKLTAPSSRGGVLAWDYENFTYIENVMLINPKLDGNHIAGTNGVGIGGGGSTNNVHIRGGHIKNCIRSTTIGGGRAVSFQLGVHNCSAIGVNVTDCTTAGDVHGRAIKDTNGNYTLDTNGNLVDQATNILMSNFNIERCEELFSFYNLGSNLEDRLGLNCKVDGFIAKNCGKSEVGSTTIDEAGLIVFERAGYVKIANGLIVNDTDYGKIGGLFRGKGYDIELENITFFGDAVALFNGKNATSLAPVTADNAVPLVRLKTFGITHVGSVDFVVQGDTQASPAANMSQCYFHETHVGIVNTNILNVGASTKTDCYGEFIQRSSGKFRKGKFNAISSYGDNSFNGSQTKWDTDPQRIAYVFLGVNGTNAVVGSEGDRDLLLRRNNVDIASLTNDGFKIASSSYDGKHLLLGTIHIWSDGVNLRYKNGVPANHQDGAILSANPM